MAAGKDRAARPPAPFRRMDAAEMERVLTGIARGGQNDAARIAAIRQLRLMRGLDAGAPPTGGEGGQDSFESLDELAVRRAGYRGK